MQKFVLRQLTPSSLVAELPLGSGTDCMDQELPSQRSASGVMTPALIEYPTAVQTLVPEGHEIPFKTVSLAPTGFGVDWIVHEAPFHVSANENVPLAVL